MITKYRKALGVSLIVISLILIPTSFVAACIIPKSDLVLNFGWLPGLIIATLLGLGLRTFESALDEEWERERREQEKEYRQQEENRKKFYQEQERSHYRDYHRYDFFDDRDNLDEEEYWSNSRFNYESSSKRTSQVEMAYSFFGLSFGAKENDVQKEFRRLAAIYHPDKPSGSEERFKELVNNRDIIYKYLGKS